MKKQFLSVLLMGAFFILLTGCESTVTEPISTEKESQEKVISFTTEFLKFNEPYKKALFPTGQANEVVANEAIALTIQEWENIESMFSKSQPAEYMTTQDWGQRLASIGTLIEEASLLGSEGDWKESHEKLEEVRKKLREIRIENNVVLLTDHMLVFHDRMESYLEKGEKDIDELENLHLDFVPILNWPEFKGDEEYRTAALSAGSIVHKLKDLEGEEYEALLKELKPAFIKFYLQFG